MSTTSRRTPVGLVVLAASIPAFMASLDNLVVTNALPVLATDLDATLEQLQWFINGYSLAFASMILMAVALGDRFGRRRVFSGGVALFTVASILCALAPTAEALIAARVLQGIGGAALMPLSLAILSTNVSARMRPLAIGIWGGVAGLGVAVGPLIGGAVVEGLTWHAIFWLNVPVGVLALVLIRAFLTETRGDRVRLDLVGLGLGMTAVFGLVFGIVRGNDAGWTSPQVLSGLVGGAVLLLGFLAWEARTRDPLLPLGLFRDRSFSVANAVGLMFSIGIFGAVFILIQFLQVVQGKSPLEAGAMTMPWTMAPLFVAPLTGIVAPRVGTRTLVTAGVALQSAGLAWIGLTLDPAVAYGELVPGFVACGVGMGLVFAPLATAVLAHMRDEDHAKASGTNATVREIGVALGIAVLTAVFTGAGGELTPTGYTDAAQTAVLWGAAILAVTTAVATLLPSRRVELGTAPAADTAPAPALAAA
ncbi:DHA2 family efflux MFS transporter permease subunit [Demequina maris]|uniref:DHA2 family efflux MFS transporter permease subunit n=1 Tax=Demequina maris TaxID=1638982 RepID=UPI0009E4E703|nr:DHA2 family efflux MFS transporter permease subunit [Demequina maris]